MKDRVEIITIGDEVLTGWIIDNNASFIAERLTLAGLSVGWMTAIGDDRRQIIETIKRAKSRAAAAVVTGGLGPTPDDLTKSCLVDFFGDRLVLRKDLLEKVKKRFADRKLPFPETSRNQAEFPQKAQMISNPIGTATGIYYHSDDFELFALPGVPQEMRTMLVDSVIPILSKSEVIEKIYIRILRTSGIGESFLLEQIKRLKEAEKLVIVAFLPNYFGVDVKLAARGSKAQIIKEQLKTAVDLLLPDLQPYHYGYDQETLPEVLGHLARTKGVRIAVAESCTGGLVAKLLTDIPGSSNYFDCGLVTYTNEAKSQLLGVPEQLIETEGAVSAAVAEAMAVNLLNKSRAHITASVTGIAGPTGATANKPVGLVYIAVADKENCQVREFRFLGNRQMNRERSAFTVIRLLYDRIKSLDS